MIFWGSTQASVSLWGGIDLVNSLNQLGLERRRFLEGEYWRLFSYQFLHAGGAHFFVNLLVLWFAGREIEPVVGRVHFLWLCLFANAVGGAFSIATMSDYPVVPIFGFSAGIAAVVAAYSTIMPELETGVSFFRLFPIRFRAKYLAVAMLLFAAVAVATGTALEVGPAGIIAGGFIGWVWARKLGFGNPFWFQRRAFERRQREIRIERMSADDFVRTEIDPILEKISRDGMQGLSRAERRTLERGRDKLTARTESTN
jgi:membrane associated rhomboid family serine protease